LARVRVTLAPVRVPALSRPGSTALRERVGDLSRSDTGRAAGLGAAMIVANVLALGFTVVFARVLGASGYGDLAVLLSSFIIMMVPGSALQIAAAREVSHDLAEGNPNAGAGVRRWLERLVVATVVVALIAIPVRSLIAALINIDQDWAAAAIPVTAMLWIILSVLRGVLQGFQQYKTVAFSIVGEASSRIAFSLILVGVGLDVTGAFLGSAFSLVAIALVLLIPLRRQMQGVNPKAAEDLRLRELLAGAWVPVMGLTLLLALQELHVIIVKHQAANDDAAGSYAVAAVAGKAIMWIAIGLGLYLLPEASRRAKIGEDARPILLRTLGLIVAMAVPAVLIFSVAGEPLLRIVFGADLTQESDALPFLGLAMSLLACSYLSVQYLLAMGRAHFLLVLAAGIVVEVPLLLSIGDDLTAIAIALLGIQAACAAAILTMALRQKRPTGVIFSGLTADEPAPEDEVVPEPTLRHVGTR
jgi:O-antigen/teichoic acid export membrane protein